MDFLVESALLTHGLKSLSNDDIRENWSDEKCNITWVSEGNIILGTMTEYLEFRKKADQVIRIDCYLLEKALRDKLSGALTASGTMEVCKKMGISLAVTCGMGGIGDIRGEELCPDLPALMNFPGGLITTGPKDMLDRKATVTWLTEHEVQVFGAKRDFCTGYIFKGDPVKLQGIYDNGKTRRKRPFLLVNEIPEEYRVADRKILEEAILQGKQAEKEGRYYHPEVNGKIDELTKGYSSMIQLKSLMENVRLAKELTGS